jgi:nitrile hydratase beta subunit
MNGIHDMGGMHGFGPIRREEDEPVFHEPWEARLYAMRRILGPRAGGRPAIERLIPQTYLSSSYYEKWLYSSVQTLVDTGVISAEELEARSEIFRRNANASVPERNDPESTARLVKGINTIRWPHRDIGVTPRFSVGDRVRARNINPPGHTRLPRYVRGKLGVVTLFHGVHDVQDELPEGADAPPEPVYSICFEAAELWGDVAEANQRLYIDMWERYLDLV